MGRGIYDEPYDEGICNSCSTGDMANNSSKAADGLLHPRRVSVVVKASESRTVWPGVCMPELREPD